METLLCLWCKEAPQVVLLRGTKTLGSRLSGTGFCCSEHERLYVRRALDTFLSPMSGTITTSTMIEQQGPILSKIFEEERKRAKQNKKQENGG